MFPPGQVAQDERQLAGYDRLRSGRAEGTELWTAVTVPGPQPPDLGGGATVGDEHVVGGAARGVGAQGGCGCALAGDGRVGRRGPGATASVEAGGGVLAPLNAAVVLLLPDTRGVLAVGDHLGARVVVTEEVVVSRRRKVGARK